jgi:hypothetical protein
VTVTELLLKRDLPLFLLSTAAGVSSGTGSSTAAGMPSGNISSMAVKEPHVSAGSSTAAVSMAAAAAGGAGGGGATAAIDSSSVSPRPPHLFQLQRIHVVTPPAPFQLVTCPQVVFTQRPPGAAAGTGVAAAGGAAGAAGRGSSSNSSSAGTGSSKGWGLQGMEPQKQQQVDLGSAAAGPSSSVGAPVDAGSGGNLAKAVPVIATFSPQAQVALPPDSWCVLMLPRMYGVPAEWKQVLSTSTPSSSSSGSSSTRQLQAAAQQRQPGAGTPRQSTDGSIPAVELVPIPYWLPDQCWSAMVAAGSWLSPGPTPAGV